MNRTWLFLDVNSLAHRAMHSTGELQYGEEATGVLFGVLRTVFELQDRFKAFSTVAAFDHGKGLREIRYPWYKETRRKRKLTDDEQETYEAMRHQVKRLRTDTFPRLGLSNILWQDGYEADDLIAAACHALPEEDSAVVVSGDKDMYQLLAHNVTVYHPTPQKLVTKKAFRREWGVGPNKWVEVKAIAGCGTDDIPGVDGVGEKTAAKFLRGEKLNKGIEPAIKRHLRSPEYKRNVDLIMLPYPGTKEVKLKSDNLDLEAKREILSDLGIRSLI